MWQYNKEINHLQTKMWTTKVLWIKLVKCLCCKYQLVYSKMYAQITYTCWYLKLWLSWPKQDKSISSIRFYWLQFLKFLQTFFSLINCTLWPKQLLFQAQICLYFMPATNLFFFHFLLFFSFHFLQSFPYPHW